ncbi:uncharacterized protein LOC129578671 [Sitodiplosis mosellana]|uniref:uncharacterized protein LOC129578671 n=1 Tax=Sitodiplosis mosellana TaxID=263140 RepID=UPI00244377F7|nr:uncharacterized protein LOC129578671 [Sitodiplosis mosellana]
MMPFLTEQILQNAIMMQRMVLQQLNSQSRAMDLTMNSNYGYPEYQDPSPTVSPFTYPYQLHEYQPPTWHIPERQTPPPPPPAPATQLPSEPIFDENTVEMMEIPRTNRDGGAAAAVVAADNGESSEEEAGMVVDDSIEVISDDESVVNLVDDETDDSGDEANDDVVYVRSYYRANEAADGLLQLSNRRSSPQSPPQTPLRASPPSPRSLPLPNGFDAAPMQSPRTPDTTRRPPTPRFRGFPRLSHSIARLEGLRREQESQRREREREEEQERQRQRQQAREREIQRGRPLCAICKEDLLANSPMVLPCNHVYCSDCLEQMFQHQPSCPVCRTGVPSIEWCDPIYFP